MQTSATRPIAVPIDTRPLDFLSYAPPTGERYTGMEELRVPSSPSTATWKMLPLKRGRASRCVPAKSSVRCCRKRRFGETGSSTGWPRQPAGEQGLSRGQDHPLAARHPGLLRLGLGRARRPAERRHNPSLRDPAPLRRAGRGSPAREEMHSHRFRLARSRADAFGVGGCRRRSGRIRVPRQFVHRLRNAGTDAHDHPRIARKSGPDRRELGPLPRRRGRAAHELSLSGGTRRPVGASGWHSQQCRSREFDDVAE